MQDTMYKIRDDDDRWWSTNTQVPVIGKPGCRNEIWFALRRPSDTFCSALVNPSANSTNIESLVAKASETPDDTCLWNLRKIEQKGFAGRKKSGRRP
ncbi:uncharacterized protein ARMOST_02169 [Armillaria ostoyae]|uniref:Uncharacterized protein n=1 Tax=Armillaria ostoyae TaxID=47428 RepID=A0A284QQY4_ARMOS|nr:uncharacterized protein ARMOST_02169 [Armillaria ostoyae]